MSGGSGIVRDVTLRLRLESAGDVQLPDWTRANGGAAAYFGTMNQGATAATQNVNSATGAVNNLGQGLQQGVTELDLLLAIRTTNAATLGALVDEWRKLGSLCLHLHRTESLSRGAAAMSRPDDRRTRSRETERKSDAAH